MMGKEMTYAEYINLVKERGRFAAEDDAARAIRSVLEVLGQRISMGQAEDIASALPPEIRPYLRQTRKAERLTLNDFLMSVSSKEGVDLRTAHDHAHAVLSALAESVPSKELKDTFEQIPRNMRALFLWMKDEGLWNTA